MNGQTAVEAHPAAEVFPMLRGDEMRALVEDIRANGLLEPLWRDKTGVLLDGRNRLAACQEAGVKPRWQTYTGDDPVGFIVSLNLHRRHLADGQRSMIATELVPMFAAQAKERQRQAGRDYGQNHPKQEVVVHVPQPLPKARDQAGKAMGVSGSSVATAKRIKDKAPDLAEQVRAGKKTLRSADKELKRRQAEAEDKAAKQETLSSGLNIDLRHGDFRTVLAGINCDAIITDPPYPREYLPLYRDLAEWAATVLPPHGTLAVMCGQSYLPDLLRLMEGPLPYRWTMAYLTPGGQSVQLWDRKVNTFWKPILVYGTPGSDWLGDVPKSNPNDNDKTHHHWGQSLSGMRDLVNRLTKPGQTVADPFMGAGTTGAAAVSLQRHFIGCDINQDHVTTAAQRLR